MPAYTLLCTPVAVDEGRVRHPGVRRLESKLLPAGVASSDAVLNFAVDGFLYFGLDFDELRGNSTNILHDGVRGFRG